MKRIRIIAIALLALILIGLGGYLFFMSGIEGPYKKVDVASTLVKVEIPEGSSTSDIASVLVRNGIVSSTWKFRVFSRLNDYDGKYLAGTYKLSPGMTSEEIANKICEGNQDMTTVTIPEGYTIAKIAEAFSDAGLVDKDAFIEATINGDFSKYDFLDGTVTGRHNLEGFLFPATYEFDEDVTEEDIINEMLSQFGLVWEKYRDRAKELSMSPNEVITVASLIEREAILDEDRRNVASVIYNRMAIDMPLQIDATVDFALSLIGESHEYITYEDLEIDSPYNTYKIYGLPPGPIACPGERCIEAALYPPDTEYLYYVKTTDQGVGMSFSTNYEDFVKDVEAWNATIENDD